MFIRNAIAADIDQIMEVRMAVRENKLSDPSKVTNEDCRVMMEERGKGWVCEVGDQIVGFCIVDLEGKNLWALFLLPAFEFKGIGQKLHEKMIKWTAQQQIDQLWLSTDPGTRAEGFYEKAGWKNTGLVENGEVRFVFDFS